MKNYSLSELEKIYDFDLDRIVKEINKTKAKIVLLQFADGLKPYATTVVDFLKEKTSSEFLIWFGTCYGACDTPVLEKDFDLLIQFGHNEMMPNF